MKKTYSAIAIVLILSACSANSSRNANNADTTTAAVLIQKQVDTSSSLLADTAKVKTWLVKVIEDYTNGKDPKVAFEILKKSLTDNYYNYKQDAINLEYDADTTMNEATFKKKWQGKYDTKYVGNGGFMISSQDNGKIKVAKCSFIKNPEQNAAVYKVLIEDQDFKTHFNRDIKIIAADNKLLIDDVLEYD